MTSPSHEQRVARGQHAARLLEDEVLRHASASARERLVAEWLDTDDPLKQRAAWAKIHALEEIATELRRLKADGEFAAESLRRAQ